MKSARAIKKTISCRVVDKHPIEVAVVCATALEAEFSFTRWYTNMKPSIIIINVSIVLGFRINLVG